MKSKKKAAPAKKAKSAKKAAKKVAKKANKTTSKIPRGVRHPFGVNSRKK